MFKFCLISPLQLTDWVCWWLSLDCIWWLLPSRPYFTWCRALSSPCSFWDWSVTNGDFCGKEIHRFVYSPHWRFLFISSYAPLFFSICSEQTGEITRLTDGTRVEDGGSCNDTDPDLKAELPSEKVLNGSKDRHSLLSVEANAESGNRQQTADQKSHDERNIFFPVG